MAPTTEAMVRDAQNRLDVADELVEAAAGLLADATDRQDSGRGSELEVQSHLLTYRRALADRRYFAAIVDAARIDHQRVSA